MPTPIHFKPVSPRKNLHEGNQVSCLIDQILHTWKEEIIQNTFLPHEAETILGIPLSSFPTEDKLIWLAIANGMFSIRSAYRVAQKLLDNENRGQIFDSTTMTGLWKSIWSLKCPCKPQNFAQRASKNILPPRLASGITMFWLTWIVICMKRWKHQGTFSGDVTWP